MKRREFLSMGWIRSALNAFTPASSERERGYDPENERTRAFVELVAITREMEDLECRRASVAREYRERTRKVHRGDNSGGQL